MRKGIINIILIYSSLQVVGLVIIAVLSTEISFKYQLATLFTSCAILLSTGFVLLGNHLNKGGNIKRWKFIVIGTIISFLSSSTFYIGMTFYHKYYRALKWNNYYSLEDFLRVLYRDLFVIPIVMGVMIVDCLVVSIFIKKLKRNSVTNDSLDSNFLDE
jgi:hypothetical protein